MSTQTQTFSLNPQQHKRIHVVSSDIRSSWIAHALGSVTKRPPVSLLVRDEQAWAQEGGMVSVLSNGEWIHTRHIKAEKYRFRQSIDEQDAIEQLIVTGRPATVTKVLTPLAPRISNKTIICLVQDGLGVREHLNATLFEDPLSRPIYILGHMTHILRHYKVSKDRDSRYTLGEEAERGVLHVSAYMRNSPEFPLLSFSPPLQTHMRVQHFLRALTTTPKLNAVSRPFGDFLTRKLPTMIFQSAIDPVSVMLDCTYGDLARSQHGLDLVDDVLREIGSVVLALPELPRHEVFKEYVSSGKLRGDIMGKLRNLDRDAESQMRWQVRNGRVTDIDYLTGWFVNRAREIGVKSPLTEMLVRMVKGKYKINRKKVDGYINIQNR